MNMVCEHDPRVHAIVRVYVCVWVDVYKLSLAISKKLWCLKNFKTAIYLQPLNEILRNEDD